MNSPGAAFDSPSPAFGSSAVAALFPDKRGAALHSFTAGTRTAPKIRYSVK